MLFKHMNTIKICFAKMLPNGNGVTRVTLMINLITDEYHYHSYHYPQESIETDFSHLRYQILKYNT